MRTTGVHVLRADGSPTRTGIDPPGRHLTGRTSSLVPHSQRIAVPVEPAAIVVARVDGSQRRRVAAGGTVPVWAPDSDHLGYTAEDLMLMLLDVDKTATAERLAAAGSYPVWSSDGTDVAFVDNQASALAGATALEPGAGCMADLAFGASWSPDGRQLAFTSSNGALTVANADGSDLTHATHVIGRIR